MTEQKHKRSYSNYDYSVLMANISDPAVKTDIKGFLDEMSASMTRSEAEKDFQKEAVKLLADKHTLDKKILRKMSSTYHRSNYATTKADQAEFETAYEALFGVVE